MEAEKELEDKLLKYLKSFSVASEITNLDKRFIELKIKDFIEELDNLKSQMEKCRAYNLISFLKFFTKDSDSALEYNQKSLYMCPGNIIGLCNRGWILLKTEENYAEIRKICKKLVATESNSLKKIEAKAEIAYTYARLGIQFYKKAYKIYHEVLSEAAGLNIEDNICTWSFGCALAQSRLFKMLNVCNESDLEVTEEHCASVCELCRNIFKTGGQSDTCKFYKPRAYVLLGQIMDDIKSKGNLRSVQVKDILPDDPDLHMTADEYFEKAFELQDDDTIVLDRCGRYFESSQNVDKSISLFRETIKIRPTSFSHHHLASVLKIQLDNKIASVVNCKNTIPENRNESDTEQKANDELSNKTWIKSPKVFQYIDLGEHGESVEEIIKNIDAANELAINTEATYDKGFIYRQTNQIELALKTFKSLLTAEGVSIVLRANVYEQLGFCLQDTLKSTISENTEELEEDMNMYFKKSLEISCNIVSKIPELAYYWESAPTLQSLLLGKAQTKQTLKDLSFLYKKIKAYGDAVDVLSNLLKMASTEGERAEIYQEIIEHYWKMEKFDDAGVALEILKCLPLWTDCVKKKIYVYIQGNVEAAMDAYYDGDKEVARFRFDNAFEFCRENYTKRLSARSYEDRKGPGEGIGKTVFRVCILCDPGYEDNGMEIHKKLTTLGVTATLNTLDIIEFGKSENQILEKNVKQSNHFLIIYDFEHDSKCNDSQLMWNFEMTKKIVSERGHGNFLTLVSTKTKQSDIPTTLPNTVSYNFDTEDEKEVDYSFIQTLLVRLAMGDTEMK